MSNEKDGYTIPGYAFELSGGGAHSPEDKAKLHRYLFDEINKVVEVRRGYNDLMNYRFPFKANGLDGGGHGGPAHPVDYMQQRGFLI